MEAMRWAVTYFKEAISSDPAFDDIRLYLATIALMTDLMVRCDDFDGAFEMIRGIYQSAAEARMRYRQRLTEKDLMPAARQNLILKIRRMDENISHAGELRQQLLDFLIERDKAKILRVLEEHKGAAPKEIEKALQEQGISPGEIAKLREKGGLLAKR